MSGRTALSSAGVLALAAVSTHSLASPLPVRDQNPLLAGFDIPAALPARLPESDRWQFDAAFAWGNSAAVQSNAAEQLIVDAETRELRLAVGRSFGDGFAWRLELPYRQTTGGSLDGFIDSWHDFFGMPEGARPRLPQDDLHIAYARDGRTLLDARSARSGIGDISLRLGKRLGAAPVTSWVAVKLPTGDADDFTGSGAVDVTAAVAFERAFADRYSVFAQAAGTWLGEGNRMRSLQNDFAWSGSAGLSARAFQDLTLTVQLDAHTAIFSSSQNFLGDAVMLSLGGSYRFTDWELAFAVTEDIAVDTSPDVVFVLRLQRSSP